MAADTNACTHLRVLRLSRHSAAFFRMTARLNSASSEYDSSSSVGRTMRSYARRTDCSWCWDVSVAYGDKAMQGCLTRRLELKDVGSDPNECSREHARQSRAQSPVQTAWHVWDTRCPVYIHTSSNALVQLAARASVPSLACAPGAFFFTLHVRPAWRNMGMHAHVLHYAYCTATTTTTVGGTTCMDIRKLWFY